jgi:hypothetical protein
MSEWSIEHAWKAKRPSNIKPLRRVNAHAISDLTFQNYRSV